ncbi:MAG: acyl-CoA dehydrogenase family protein [Candidatus Kariarchaeum pelagius]|jgi:alkylation response protein AidB-like acyl-CoA dehydrogenase|tara:strand:+ start:58 stop:1203 length:1146 start_codon:yes stop_codon:yes gene_type:complete
MNFLLTEEEILIRDTIKDLSLSKFKDRATDIDSRKLFPTQNISELAELGLLGSIIDEKYGGAGSSILSYALILEEIAKSCASTSVITSVTTMVARAIEKAGSEKQKTDFLPRITSGKTLGAFCLTEANAGSDPSSLQTSAKIKGNSYIINGEKLWVTNAPHADILLVMANENPDLGHKGISAFIIDKSQILSGDLEVGEPENKMGLNGSHTSPIFFNNVEIPIENKLSESGKGLSIALNSLDIGRIGIAAQATGIADAAFEASLAYSKQREQFNQPISKFQGISFKLADMKMKLEVARTMTHKAAWMADQGLKHTLESSMAKTIASENAFDITSNAIKIHGGMGYSKEYPLERYLRDVQATLIYEGTNEIQRLVISRSLGL